MFKFLKEKLKNAISRFSKKAGEAEELQIEKLENIKEAPKKETKEKIKEKPLQKEAKKEKKEPIKQEKKIIEKLEQEEAQLLEEEKQILEEEKKIAKEPIKEISQVDREVEKIKKEEQIKELEEKRLEKEESIKEIEIEKEPFPKEKKSFFGLFKRKEKEPAEEKQEQKPEPVKEEKKGFFQKVGEQITTTKINESKFDELFWDLELALLENNVAVEVIEKIKQDLKKNLVDKPLSRSKVSEIIINTLKKSVKEILEIEKIDLLSNIKKKKPYVICFVGINGSGKTTTIAKIVHLLQKNKLTSVLAASDTFRAAAIDQIQFHADKLGVKLIKQDYGSDPAAVAFDAIKHAEAKNIDVVLIDTAGRMHSNANLIDEMKKIIRVAKPDLKLFIGESITGNDCIEQAKEFNQAITIDGIVLSKADIDEKGGAALSVSYITKKPILFIGTGQNYEDLKEFTSDIVMENLGL